MSEHPESIELLLEPEDNERLRNLCGQLDEHLRQIERRLGIEINNRGNRFQLLGDGRAIVAGSEILQGDIVKGNTIIGKHTRIESSVNITGSDEFPTRIGDNVLIKGTSYVFGAIIESGCWIEHSVIIKQHVDCVRKKDGTIQKIKYFLPLPEGIDSLRPIEP